MRINRNLVRELKEKKGVMFWGKREIGVSRIFSRIREKHKLFGRKEGRTKNKGDC